MYHKNKVLGLILGGGGLVETLIKECNKRDVKNYIIAVDDDFKLKKIKPDIKINFDNLGNIFSHLKNKRISQVVLLGSINKKPLFKIKPNLITFHYLLKLFFLYRKDGRLINKIVKLFENNNINIIDSRIFLKKNLSNRKYNNLIKFKKYLNKSKIQEYFLIAKKFGKLDKGQAVIISDGKLVLKENSSGTDILIKKFRFFKNYKFSCLVKVTKPNQDIRIDLPTIGPKTIENMIKVGINGIIVEHQKTFIESPDLTFNLINQNNIMFYAV